MNFGQVYFHLLLLVFEVVNFIIFLLDFLLEFYLLLLKLVVSARDVLRVLFKEHLLLFQILGPLVIEKIDLRILLLLHLVLLQS